MMEQYSNEMSDMNEPVYRNQQRRTNQMTHSWNKPFSFGSPNPQEIGISKSADFGKIKLDNSPPQNSSSKPMPTSPFKLY
jgi:hypothetical protein